MIKINKIVLITILILMKFKMVTSNKYCSLQSVTGQSRYFMCGRHEYCCTFGCCVHLAFQFYQLWYYWLLLIFMFMVCSGGSWWYRFCRQSDSSGSIRNQINNGSDTGSYYGANHHLLHSTPTRSSNSGNNGRHSNVAANDYERRVTLVRNNGVHSYYYRNGRNSNYYDTASVRYHNGVTGDRTLRRYQQQQQQHAHQTNFLPRLELCPYYQLYGPPPSYESVVQLSSDNLSTSCTLAEPITTIAPITNDEQQSNCIGSTLVTPPPPTSTLSSSSSPRIIQPIVTVNLSNALSTSIEVRPICTASTNLPLGEPLQQSQTSHNKNLNHVEVIQQQQQQQQQPIQHSIENHIMTDENSQEHNNKNQLATIESNNDILQSDNIILDDQKQIYENACTATTTTTTTIVPLPYRTNFIMRNEKNSIPSVCSSISTLTTIPNKYCNSNEQQQIQQQQQQQHQSALIQQHQQPTTSTILKDFDNTQCTCSMGSSTTMSLVSPSTTNTNKSNKFLKSSKFNRKYYKKNSNNSNNSISNNSNNLNNCTISRGTNCSRISPDESTINTQNNLNNVDRSVIVDNNCLVSNPNNDNNMMIQTTQTTQDTIVTSLPMAVAIAKTPSKKH
ncbi:myb-like protein AA [Condylostylus longicornis]|uniref:myb-like protein AA n=1 Tax=Condylostylus longicornis TaxID=2530218 RepID=UPI00244E549F|nr:myb-like protein AA [Condylostylus longicornis]